MPGPLAMPTPADRRPGPQAPSTIPRRTSDSPTTSTSTAVRTGRANKYDGKVSLFPSRDSGGGDIDVEVALAPEHMAALEQDPEFWAAVSPDARKLDH